MTQAELAEAVGVSQESVARYEKGDTLPPIDVAARMASALGVALDRLISQPVYEWDWDQLHVLREALERERREFELEKENFAWSKRIDGHMKGLDEEIELGIISEEDRGKILAALESTVTTAFRIAMHPNQTALLGMFSELIVNCGDVILRCYDCGAASESKKTSPSGDGNR
jgi:transcriptional regulator with XRE-family HTH domain